ncbi:heme peroxidase [Lipomyces chichibuensis]|uniref:heme peroxidase n=1 Tax=Lipomyces chichibuensis TaxID=1546026 RepID=UPI003343018E
MTDSTGLYAGGIIGDVVSQVHRVPQDLALLANEIMTKINKGIIDDKDMALEHFIQFASSLPSDSKEMAKLNDGFIQTLWNELQHPPLDYLGDEWRYRTADGSNNNRMYPYLGRSGGSYARTVEPEIQLPPNLPDPGIIFDELFARGEKLREHPNRISSVLFYMGSILVHDLFRTSDEDPNKVNNSSYLDLGPLYGHNYKEQALVRTFKDGLLKPDTFSEIRVLGFPPGVATLLVCFNRFHNYVAKELAEINEGGQFTLLSADGMTRAQIDQYQTPENKRDNDLFQTARLITCGLYVNIITTDYLRAILNLNRSSSQWVLDPRANLSTVYGQHGIPEGIGNQVSVEFNLIYRWHSAISARDEQWTIDFFKKYLRDKDPSTITVEELWNTLKKFGKAEQAKLPEERTFGGLTRQANGTFADAELVKILYESTDDVAASFGARNVPVVMRAIEMLGIQQARGWHVATLNEFRKFFKLMPYKTFSDISSIPGVAQSLETLYKDVNHVELYPGLVAENAKPREDPGAGLCPGYTTSRAILADAVALVRGDRFYTVDYNAGTMTNWGFNHIQPNPNVAHGGVIYKLFMRAFPGYYRGASVYAMFPFTVPDETRLILRKLGKEGEYDFSKPSFIPRPTAISTWTSVVEILNDQKRFKVPCMPFLEYDKADLHCWGNHTYEMIGHDYMLSGDAPANTEQRNFVSNALYSPENAMEEVAVFAEGITSNLLHEMSRKLRHSFLVDAVDDIANLSHSIIIAHLFNIPLKTHTGPVKSGFTAREFYNINALLFAYVFRDIDAAQSFGLRFEAQQSTEAFSKVAIHVCQLVRYEHFRELKELLGLQEHDTMPDYGQRLIQRLFHGGKSVDEVASVVIATAAAAVATQAQAFAQILDLYLSDEYKKHWAAIQELARSENSTAFTKLKRYAMEGLRLATPSSGTLRVAADDVFIKDGSKTVNIRKGDRVFTNFAQACVDKDEFVDPHAVKLDRPDSSYIHFGYGPHSCLGRRIVENCMAAQLKVFGKLKNLRRAPGGQGFMKCKTVNGSLKMYLKEDCSDWWPYPTTMKVMFDDFE